MNKKKLIILTICVIIVIIIAILFAKRENHENEGSSSQLEENKTVDEVKEELNITGDSEIYQTYEEPGGRTLLQIKPDVQYETVLAGIMKGSIPEERRN